jgi:hypothetical protein
VAVCLPWAVAIIHPTILDLNRSPSAYGGRGAVLHIRGSMTLSAGQALCAELGITFLQGWVLGCVGGMFRRWFSARLNTYR